MRIKYNDDEYVVDPEINFMMPAFCYETGANCNSCIDSSFGDCPLEEVTIEELLKSGERIHA